MENIEIGLDGRILSILQVDNEGEMSQRIVLRMNLEEDVTNKAFEGVTLDAFLANYTKQQSKRRRRTLLTLICCIFLICIIAVWLILSENVLGMWQMPSL